MTFYFDENLPPALAAALHELEQGLRYGSSEANVVRHVVREFGRGAKDEYWVPAAARSDGCVIITEDWKMQRIKQLQPICREQDIVMIFFRPASRGMKYWDKVEILIRKWPEIKTLARRRRPAAYQISVRGKPRQLW